MDIECRLQSILVFWCCGALLRQPTVVFCIGVWLILYGVDTSVVNLYKTHCCCV